MCPLLVAAVTIAAASASAQSLPRVEQSFSVRMVVDGDTLDLTGAGRVRLAGIDAPEFGSGFETPAPFARESRARLAALALHRWVRLELEHGPRDTYGRLLAYVFRTDGVFLNGEVVRSGLARVSARQPLRRLGELRRLEEEAQRARRGIWGERPSIPERSFRIPRSFTRPTRFSDRPAP